MRIVVGEWFWMPRVGGDVFKALVNGAGLQYDRSKGFQATPETDLALVASILKDALKEDVEMALKCFVCGGSVDCERCRYCDVCGGAAAFQSCVCQGCEEKEEAPSLYAMRFTQITG